MTGRLDRSVVRRMRLVGPEEILKTLSDRQYMHPHRPVGDALRDAAAHLGMGRTVLESVMQWLDLDASRSMGRLRRTELLQLARSMHRLWRHAPLAEQNAR